MSFDTFYEWDSHKEHFICCDEATTTFTIKKQSMVFKIKINHFNENIFNKNHRIKIKHNEWLDLDAKDDFIGSLPNISFLLLTHESCALMSDLAKIQFKDLMIKIHQHTNWVGKCVWVGEYMWVGEYVDRGLCVGGEVFG